ncbi:MAG: 4Fe-4S dicluster domain-containing protein [bacterium]|nr:4Fe-4S dicluster domain-containing protein [bacterium]
MNERQAKLRSIAGSLLAEGRVSLFIGFGPGLEPSRPVPWFAKNADEAGKLVLDPFCGPGLARYLLDETAAGPAGIVARGCDGLGLERLVADKRVGRDQVYVVGVACRGAVDPDKARRLAGRPVFGAEVNGETVALTTAGGRLSFPRSDCLLDRCLACADPSPRTADTWLEEPLPGAQREFEGVEALEKLGPDDRYAFWARHLERCLRCHACRNACPACNCVACSLDNPEWLERTTGLADHFMFHFTRAYHVAGRCVACGECQRACPVGIPLMLLNEKFMKDIRDLFAVPDPHRPQEAEPLGHFSPDDPEGWREGDETL